MLTEKSIWKKSKKLSEKSPESQLLTFGSLETTESASIGSTFSQVKISINSEPLTGYISLYNLENLSNTRIKKKVHH